MEAKDFFQVILCMLWMNRYKVTCPKVLLKCRTFFIICQSLDFLQSKIGKICYLIISEFFGRNYTLCNFDTLETVINSV